MNAPAPQLRVTTAPSVPIGDLLVGRTVDEAIALVPRVFNLCRAAQEAAVKLAFDRPVDVDIKDRFAIEFTREHMLRLGVVLAERVGCAPLPLSLGPEALIPADLPCTEAEFDAYLRSDAGIAPILSEIDHAFSAGEAVANVPTLSPRHALGATAVENSTAVRHMDHPLMQIAEARKGRGPLWRAVARMIDLDACMRGDVPLPSKFEDGTVIVPASRGFYAVRAFARDGIVVAFERATPTDHCLAEGGIMAQSLSTLPRDKQHLAQLVVDILDPCQPVTLKGGAADA